MVVTGQGRLGPTSKGLPIVLVDPPWSPPLLISLNESGIRIPLKGPLPNTHACHPAADGSSGTHLCGNATWFLNPPTRSQGAHGGCSAAGVFGVQGESQFLSFLLLSVFPIQRSQWGCVQGWRPKGSPSWEIGCYLPGSWCLGACCEGA